MSLSHAKYAEQNTERVTHYWRNLTNPNPSINILLLNNQTNPCEWKLEGEICRSLPETLKQAYQSPEEKSEKGEVDIDPTSQTPTVRDLVNRIKTP